MADEILETQAEQEHNEAMEDSAEREEKVHEAIDKIVTTIEEFTDDPTKTNPQVRNSKPRFPCLRKIADNASSAG